jgi:hypothetical protein
MHRIRTCTLAGVLAASLLGCDVFTALGTACTTEARPGILVEVRDSTSGEPATAGATLLAVSGAYRDSISYPANAPDNLVTMALAYERAGVYAVTVTRPGYSPWRAPAWVREGSCHVKTMRLFARLQASS